MDWEWLLLAVCLQAIIKDTTSKDIIAQVYPKRLIQYVPERFLSMTIDPGSILVAGNLGTEALNMAQSLSPCFVRLGGKSTNYIKFGKELLMENTTITEDQWDSVCKFGSAAGLDLIASINPTDRMNGVWDSRDALQLISYSEGRGYNVAWQLGYDTDGISASGAEVGRDIVRLRKILDGFSKFSHSPIFGPDLGDVSSSQEAIFARDLLYQAGPVLGAIFLQPKFKGDEDPGDTMMNAIVSLDNNVWGKALRFGRLIPRKPIWIAEREISQGTSDDAIALIRRLGSAARIGVQVVMRQVGPQALAQPTPEFWTALMYKKLVGRGVLDARINSGNRSEIPIFSHCTQSLPQGKTIIDAEAPYDKGAVTVFGVNESPEGIKLSLKAGMKEEKVHVYSLTFADSPNGGIEETHLNGQRLSLSPSGDLPLVSPRVIKRPSRTGITVPAKSVFFIVLPDVKSRSCTSMSLVQVAEVRELSKKLIQVAGDVLDKPHALRNVKSEDSDPNQVFVKFGKPSNVIKSTEVENKPSTDTLDNSNMIDTLADSMVTANDQPVAEETTILPEIITMPINADDNCTADTSEASIPAAEPVVENTRRKRSLADNNPGVDMVLSANENSPDQDELVKRFNSYANKVYESSRSGGGDIQITNIPEDIFNTLKRVKVTFKNLGTTSSPLIEESSAKEGPMKMEEKEDLENSEMPSGNEAKAEMSEVEEVEDLNQGLDDMKEPSVFSEAKQEPKQRVAKQVNFSDSDKDKEDNKEDLETGENTFRDSQNSNDGNANQESAQGEKAVQGPDAGAETEPAPEPSRPAPGESKEGVSGDDSIREGDSTPQPTADEGAGKAGETSDARSEDEAVDESTKDGGDTQQQKLGRLSAADTTTDAGATNTPEPTTQNNKEAAEDNAKLTEATTENAPQDKDSSQDTKNNEIIPEKSQVSDSSVLTTTEIPDVIAIEGIEPKKVDELLLKIAKSDANSTDVMPNADSVEKNAEIKSADINEVDEQSEKAIGPDEKPLTESEEKQNLEESPADMNSLPDEEETNSEPEKSANIKEVEEVVLKKGPEIPTSNGLETVKVPREIADESESGAETESDMNKPLSLVLDPTMNLQDEAETSKAEADKEGSEDAQQTEEAKDGTPDSQSSALTSGEKEMNEKSSETAEAKESPVVSFKDVPLEDSEDKSYTPKTPSAEKEDEEKPIIKEVPAKEVTDNEVDETNEPDAAEDVPPSSEVEQLSQDKSVEASPDETENEEGTQVQRSATLLPLTLQSLVLPMAGSQLSKPSPATADKTIEETDDNKLEHEPEQDNEEKKEEDVEVLKEKKEEDENVKTKKLDLKVAGEKDDRRLRLLAIRNQILEARERFKAAAREEGWRAALQRREEEMRNMLNQDRDKRKFIALPVPGSERTLLSRPRRLTYDPASAEEGNKEDLYDYNTQPFYHNPYGPSLSQDYENDKPYIPEQVLPLAYNKPDQNHVIFPLDPKSPQAVVYNNRIIPAKLYGLISVNDQASKQKTGLDLPAESFYQKFLKSYNALPAKEKCKACASEVPSLKPEESYRIPRDSQSKSFGSSEPNFIPVVVLAPHVNTLRRKRSLPQAVDTLLKPQPNPTDVKKITPALQKRSLEPEVVSYTFLNEIPKEGLKLTDSFLKANEIKAVTLGESGGFKPVDISDLEGFKPVSSSGGYKTGGSAQSGGYKSGGFAQSAGYKSDGLGVQGGYKFDGLGQSGGYKSIGSAESGYKGMPMFYDYSPYGTSSELGYGDARTVGGLPPLPGLLPLPPPPPSRLLPLPPPPPPGLLPPEPRPPHSNYSPDPLPPMEKHLSPQPPQTYFFTMLQDKFKSLVGMLESLADWCGANSEK